MNSFAAPGDPLRQQDTSMHEPVHPIDPSTSPLLRNPHRREPSKGTIRFADEAESHASPGSSTHTFQMAPIDTHAQGLGISRTGSSMSISRVPVGGRGRQTPPTSVGALSPSMRSPSRVAPSPPTPTTPYFSNSSSKSSPRTPGSARPLLSPSQANEQGSYGYDRGALPNMPEQDDEDYDISSRNKQMFAHSINMQYGTRGDDDNRNKGFSHHDIFEQENGSNGNFDDNDNDHTGLLNGCPAKHDVLSSKNNWLSISILILSIYSTIFSGIYLVVALYQPRYGRKILTGGKLPPATASTLFALFAKTIELSFITVFVAFLGQVLSRRSFVKASRGVNIAELTMRTWVLQPGFMITHWHVLQHAGLTILGAITLTAAFIAMSYTTASDALVSPHLKYGNWQIKQLYGLVKTSYANANYVAKTCPTPVTLDVDSLYAGTTCLSVLHAGQAQHNQITYLDTWRQIRDIGEGISSDLSQRPQAPAMMFDNTTVTGSWILTSTSNMTAAYLEHHRIVNNISMAMPHAGVIAAAHQTKNEILQPEELDGVGEYSVKAAVVSPAINVLCANMNATELEPIIYVTWPYANTTESKDRPGQMMTLPNYDLEIIPVPGATYLNSTVVDDIFEWGPKYNRQPPVFGIYPIEYNSVVNVSVPAPIYDRRDAIYLLIKAENTTTDDYTMCQIRSFLTPSCSTHYNVSGKTGGKLLSRCEDPHDATSYYATNHSLPTMVSSPDWRDVGSEWIRSLALNTGISNANASTSRLLSQFIVVDKPPELPSLMPSIAESLAVMAGSTLLLSSTDAPFNHTWDYATHILEGTQVPFHASLASQEFASGYAQRWQSMFYIVLMLVFITNVVCLVYFFIRPGLVTDYTEPQNLFALAINSPPSRRLNGSCGAGPEGDQFNVDWHVSREENSDHYFIKDGASTFERDTSFMGLRKRTQQRKLNHVSSYTKLSSKHKSWL